MAIDKKRLSEALATLAQNIFWPAAAGNVFWALFSVTFDSDEHIAVVAPQAVLLFLAATYLSINWLRQHRSSVTENASVLFWILDWVHLIFIVITVNAAHYAPEWLSCALAAQLTVTTFGHVFGFWEIPGEASKRKYWLASINALGVASIFFSHAFGIPEEWAPTFSFGLVLFLWITTGRVDEIKKAIGAQSGDGES